MQYGWFTVTCRGLMQTQRWIRLQIHGLPIIHCSLLWTTHLGSSGIREWTGLKEMTGASREASYPPTRASCFPVLDQLWILQEALRLCQQPAFHHNTNQESVFKPSQVSQPHAWFPDTKQPTSCCYAIEFSFVLPLLLSFEFLLCSMLYHWEARGGGAQCWPFSMQLSIIKYTLVPTTGYLGEMLTDSSA